MVCNCHPSAQENRQRDQELLEHPPEEAAGQDGHRSLHPQGQERRPRLRRRPLQERRQPQPHGAVGERTPRSRGAPREGVEAPCSIQLHDPTAAAASDGVVLVLVLHHRTASCSARQQAGRAPRTASLPRRAQGVARSLAGEADPRTGRPGVTHFHFELRGRRRGARGRQCGGGQASRRREFGAGEHGVEVLGEGQNGQLRRVLRRRLRRGGAMAAGAIHLPGRVRMGTRKELQWDDGKNRHNPHAH
ncbi:hypothetical protein GW17_00041959 [Ensete ventricosum]|nr:hypothetical protein GW17_00041959 [Ensete ventricosum]RZR93769.1 hypothetical protein BHM03_00022342 [Ensete ventricosum]